MKDVADGRRLEESPYPSRAGHGSTRETSLVSVVLGLQRTAGNRAVQHVVQRDGFGAPATRSPFGDEFRLRLDPEIEAQMRAMNMARALDAVRRDLAPDRLRPLLTQLPVDPGAAPPAPNPLTTPAPSQSAPAPAPQGTPRDAEDGPAEARTASVGDLIRAIMALPAVDTALTSLQERALEQVSREWTRLRAGEAVALITVGAAIGAGATAGIVSDPEARRTVLGVLNGRVLPVPFLTGLGAELNTEGDNVMVGLHLDVGRFLPSSLGFGPGSPSPLGAPPGSGP